MNKSILAVSLLLAGCSGTTDTEVDKNDPTDTPDPTPPDPTPIETADTGYEPPPYFEPVAVGFELIGGVNTDGSLAGFADPTYGIIPPLMTVTFASLDFFYSGGMPTEDMFCTAFAFLPTGPTLPPPAQVPTLDGTILHQSWEMALPLDIDPMFTDCDEDMDPAVWGADAIDLLGPFAGARFGLGFGPLNPKSEFLTIDPANYTPTQYQPIYAGMFGMYIAINDLNGNWLAEDWTLGLLFEWDELTQAPTVDGDGFLTFIDAMSTGPGTPLPTGYIQSDAFWYQDFPLLDLSNLQDGAP